MSDKKKTVKKTDSTPLAQVTPEKVEAAKAELGKVV